MYLAIIIHIARGVYISFYMLQHSLKQFYPLQHPWYKIVYHIINCVHGCNISICRFLSVKHVIQVSVGYPLLQKLYMSAFHPMCQFDGCIGCIVTYFKIHYLHQANTRWRYNILLTGFSMFSLVSTRWSNNTYMCCFACMLLTTRFIVLSLYCSILVLYPITII